MSFCKCKTKSILKSIEMRSIMRDKEKVEFEIYEVNHSRYDLNELKSRTFNTLFNLKCAFWLEKCILAQFSICRSIIIVSRGTNQCVSSAYKNIFFSIEIIARECNVGKCERVQIPIIKCNNNEIDFKSNLSFLFLLKLSSTSFFALTPFLMMRFYQLLCASQKVLAAII